MRCVHVAAHRVEVFVILYWKRFEPALVDVPATGGVSMCVPSLCMRERQPASKFRKLLVQAGLHNQMPVIRHQALAKQSHLILFNGLGSPFWR